MTQRADFPLRGASDASLTTALEVSFAEFLARSAQALAVAGFVQTACEAGVGATLATKMATALRFGEEMGVVRRDMQVGDAFQKAAEAGIEVHLSMAERGVRIASITMLHNACERFYCRLLRFGAVTNRHKAMFRVARHEVEIGTVSERGIEAVFDERIEKWLKKVEGDGLPKIWDCLTQFLGYPPALSDLQWRFGREDIATFDATRHDAVHRDAQAVMAFDFETFFPKLLRTQFLWLHQAATSAKLRLSAENLFRPPP